MTSSADIEEQHRNWLEDIRLNIWDRITFEGEMVPSTEALWRHWKRSCWVIEMWSQADRNTMQVADITSCGWNVIDGILSIEWDSDDNQAAISERILLLTKGCKCRTGCTTGRCGCQKKGQSCSEGCMCQHCSNLPKTSGNEDKSIHDSTELEMEENRGQPQTSDSDNEMQHFSECLLAPTSDSCMCIPCICRQEKFYDKDCTILPHAKLKAIVKVLHT